MSNNLFIIHIENSMIHLRDEWITMLNLGRFGISMIVLGIMDEIKKIDTFLFFCILWCWSDMRERETFISLIIEWNSKEMDSNKEKNVC